MANKKKTAQQKIAAAKLKAKKAAATPKTAPAATKKKPLKPKVIKREGRFVKRADGLWYDGDEVLSKSKSALFENKKNWKKGQSGNPSGRPLGSKNRSTVLKELLGLKLRKADGGFVAHPLDPDKKQITAEEAVAAALIKKALKGDVAAIREIQDTIYGKIKDKMEISDAPTVIRDDIPDDD
jgi:hypothetical protein